jgi:hypothetical protein
MVKSHFPMGRVFVEQRRDKPFHSVVKCNAEAARPDQLNVSDSVGSGFPPSEATDEVA